MRNVVALILLAVWYSATGFTQQLPPGMTIHRLKAGTLDQAGWAEADSTEGAFSVKLPCAFNDFTMDQTSANTPVIKGYTLGCLRPDRRKFSATRIQYRGGENFAKSNFERNANGANWPGADIAKSIFKGLPVVDVKAKNQTQCGFLRFVLAPPDSFFLAVEAPLETCAGLEVQSTEFFKSLTVRKR